MQSDRLADDLAQLEGLAMGLEQQRPSSRKKRSKQF